MKRSGIEETEVLDCISLTGYGTPKELTVPAKKNGNFDHPHPALSFRDNAVKLRRNLPLLLDNCTDAGGRQYRSKLPRGSG
jgi:hypothetical protein